MLGFGYFEVVSLSLSNPRDQYTSMNMEDDKKAIRVRNPVSEDHVLVRTSLVPSLMNILRKNKHRELPQRMFEVGEVVLGGGNRTLLAGVSIHAKASFTEVKSLVQSVLSSMSVPFEIASGDHPSFIKGRCASVSSGQTRLGHFGEVAPSTIEAFELKYPTVAFELDLETILGLRSSHRGQ
jgi:phenylalanyl-tRNA synthetase beta chain